MDGTIVQPGKPGEDSRTLDEAPEIEPADANDADIAFAQMMVPHHAQALEMAAFAPEAGEARGCARSPSASPPRRSPRSS